MEHRSLIYNYERLSVLSSKGVLYESDPYKQPIWFQLHMVLQRCSFTHVQISPRTPLPVSVCTNLELATGLFKGAVHGGRGTQFLDVHLHLLPWNLGGVTPVGAGHREPWALVLVGLDRNLRVKYGNSTTGEKFANSVWQFNHWKEICKFSTAIQLLERNLQIQYDNSTTGEKFANSV